MAIFNGTSSNDTITGTGAADTFNTATTSLVTDFSFNNITNVWTLTTTTQGTDNLTSIESLLFTGSGEVITLAGNNWVETRANTTTTGAQDYASITALADGGYIITWSSLGQDGGGYGIYTQRYNIGGIAVGPETRVNTTTVGTQYLSSVATLGNGGYVITWSSNQDGDGFGVYAQRYNSSGTAIGPETRVNTTTTNTQYDSSIAALTDGGYIITWTSYGQDGDIYGIYAQRYNSSGVAVGSETRVNTTTANDQAQPSVAALTDGGYVITWASNGQDGDVYGIYAQRYNSSGVTVGGETRVNTYTTAVQYTPSIASLTDGGYVVSWASFGQDGDGYGIYFQRYNSSGIAVGSETRVNTTTTDDQVLPRIAALTSGGYVITWTSMGQDGSDNGAYAQRYNSSGVAVGSETRVNTTTANNQQESSVTALADGGYVITWTSDLQDGDAYGVYSQRFNADGSVATTPRITGDSGNNTLDYYGTIGVEIYGGDGSDDIDSDQGNDLLNGNLGNDNVNGWSGNDTVYGGQGDDMVYGGTGDDYVLGGLGNDTASGGSGSDTVMGGQGNDTVSGDNDNDTVMGGIGDDTVNGNLGDDIVYGNDGNDNVWGGQNNDTCYGDTGLDYVLGGLGNDTCYGGDDTDTVLGGQGDDTVYGGNGNDIVGGGLGNDTMYGDAGADIFVFYAAELGDTIGDFTTAQGDKIDLSAIDANINVSATGDQAFTFIGSSAFSNVAGQLRFDSGTHLLSGDTDGNGSIDLVIWLTGVSSLSATDFVL